MATSSSGYVDRNELGGAGPLVAGIGTCTVLLTASFIGMVGLVSGNAVGLLARMPLYVLGSSVAFVATLLLVDGAYANSTAVLGRAAVAGVGTFVLATLGAEGAVYALMNPGAVVASHLFVYLLSAAIIASGLGYWGARNLADVRTLADEAGL